MNRVAALVLAACVALTVAFTAVAIDPSESLAAEVLYNSAWLLALAACVLRVVVRRDGRVAWGFVAAFLALSWLGDLWWTTMGDDGLPVPSVADALYLSAYPCLYAGLVLLIRPAASARRGGVWLDGAIAALAVAAVASVTLVSTVADASTGGVAEAATNLAYPLADTLLLALLGTTLAFFGHRAGRMLGFLAAGLAVQALIDSVYLVQAAQGTYVEWGIVDAGWLVGALLIALAAWQAPTVRSRTRDTARPSILLPSVAGITAVALLVYGNAEAIPLGGLILATGCLLGLVLRLAMVFRADARLLAETRRESMTDAVTGLGNRRRLLRDLEHATDLATATAPDTPAYVLALFDLDGFKGYNDAFGHPAGDALLARLGRRLELAVGPYGGDAYRMGGDEFCALLPLDGTGSAATALDEASFALTARGEGFVVTASRGEVRLPVEAEDPAVALLTADQRMYAVKRSTRPDAKRQSTDVLLRVLREGHPEIGAHMAGVGELARRVAIRFGLAGEELERTVAAAELHDVGKIAVPDGILEKPGPLDEAEWDFVRRHPAIGQRILDAAPALGPVSRLVRASHERWDGAGYPDGLAGDGIPAGARVVAVCDAFTAMTEDRPYRKAGTVAAALAELRACAGTQFDPQAVAAVVAVAVEPTAGDHASPGSLTVASP